MLDSVVIPIICTTNLCQCAQWFVHIKTILHHALLKDEERLLLLWFASRSANNPHFVCFFNYEQLSIALNRSPKAIHRLLFRLRTLGFLQGDIPIWYAALPAQMIMEMREIKVLIPPAYQGNMTEERESVLPRHTNRTVTLNLINKTRK